MLKVEHIRRDIDAICLSSLDRNLVPPDRIATDITDRSLRSFYILNENNLCDLIKNSARKSCVLDPFPTNLVCDSLEVLLPVITKMVNASLSIAHFPSEWKEATVNPLLTCIKGAPRTLLTRTCDQSAIYYLYPRLLRALYLTSCTPTLQITNYFLYGSRLIGNHTVLRRRCLK